MSSDISTLMDGELDPDEVRQLLGDMKKDSTLREAWSTYHLIGDSLRGSTALGGDLSARLAARLAAEPTVLAPAARNATRKRFPALALAASVSAFGFVGLLAWQVVKVNSAPLAPVVASVPETSAKPAQAVQLAAAPAKRSIQEPARVKFSAAAGESYLLAHQEFSGSYAVAGMPAYVRTVSETEGGQ